MRNIAQFFCLIREVVRVHAYAMAAHQTRPEWQKVPFAACSVQHFLGVYVHALENHRKFVHQRNVQVALGVFNHFGCFGNPDGAGTVNSGSNHGCINIGHDVQRGGIGARHNFLDFGKSMFAVARINSLRAVADCEVCTELQARTGFEHRHTVFFGGTWVNRRFINHDGTRLKCGRH